MATVLLVDDDTKTRDVLKRRLVVEGYQVVEAVDGEGALAQYRHFPTDLVMADLRLPGMTGEQFIGELLRQHGPVRVLAISGAPERLEGVRFQHPVIQTLVKPFTNDQLLAAMGAALGNTGPQPAARGFWGRLRALLGLR